MLKKIQEGLVNRIVLIDHRDDGNGCVRGRVFDSNNLSVELCIQDEGQTLKIFITDNFSKLAAKWNENH